MEEINCNEFPQIHKIINGRPIIGSIIIDNYLYSEIDISNDDKYRKEFFSSNFLHHFTHILGFYKTILGIQNSKNYV